VIGLLTLNAKLGAPRFFPKYAELTPGSDYLLSSPLTFFPEFSANVLYQVNVAVFNSHGQLAWTNFMLTDHQLRYISFSYGDTDIPEECKIENWPTLSDEAQSAFQDMTRMSHWVIPIPAYDIPGNLILPTQYRNQLEDPLHSQTLGYHGKE
jgi:hypothetical protein